VGGGPAALPAGSREARRAWARCRRAAAWAPRSARPRSPPHAAIAAARVGDARLTPARWGGGTRRLAPPPCAPRGRSRGAHRHHAGLQPRRGLTVPAVLRAAIAAPGRWPVVPRPEAVRGRPCRVRPRLELGALIPVDLPVDLVVVLEQQERERQARRGERTPAGRVPGESYLRGPGEHVFAR
jgi:hypothetical protein